LSARLSKRSHVDLIKPAAKLLLPRRCVGQKKQKRFGSHGFSSAKNGESFVSKSGGLLNIRDKAPI